MNIQRWTSQTSFDGLSHRMVEFEHGEYVKLHDHQQALSALEARIAELEKALQNLDDAVMREGIERTEDEGNHRSGEKFIALVDALKQARALSPN